MFGPNSRDSAVDVAISDMYARTNLPMTQFANCHSTVRYNLIRSLCMSSYGSPLRDYSSNHVTRFYTAWIKCVRRVLCLHALYNPHNIITQYLRDFTVDVQLHRRFLNLLISAFDSKNVCLCNTQQ